MLTENQIAKFREELLQRKKENEHQFKENSHYNLTNSELESTGELSMYDNHPGDMGTELYEREKDLALNEHQRNELEAIDKALEAIDQGTYGKCADCKENIPVERLEAVPTALYCVKHSPEQVISRDRPIEERVLTPPLNAFDDQDRNENIAYDTEDAWQDVAQYGTSETPADLLGSPEKYDDMYTESEENIGYVEDYENFVGVDITGKKITIYPNKEHDKYEEELDEEGIMTSFGDLPAFEHDSYTEEAEKEKKE